MTQTPQVASSEAGLEPGLFSSRVCPFNCSHLLVSRGSLSPHDNRNDPTPLLNCVSFSHGLQKSCMYSRHDSSVSGMNGTLSAPSLWCGFSLPSNEVSFDQRRPWSNEAQLGNQLNNVRPWSPHCATSIYICLHQHCENIHDVFF